jgi:hypothetical protein
MSLDRINEGIQRASTELWWAWAEIAGEQERAAANWRDRALAALSAAENPSKSIAQETKATMAAIVASAASLETLGRSLREFATSPRGGGAAQRLLGTVSAVFPDSQIGPTLQESVKEVFERRNRTVHYTAAYEEMGTHPLGIRTAWVARTFTFETAADCVNTLADLVTAITHPGRSNVDRAEWWAQRNRFFGKQLRARAGATLPLDLVP